jgi:branched-chain amino acid transport system permease protein
VSALPQVLVNGLLAAGIYMLVASGVTLIFGVMKIINFAHGELVMLGGYVAFWAFSLFRVDPILCLLVSSLALALVGAVLYLTIVRPVISSRIHINQIMVTFGLSLLLQNIVLLIWNADTRKVSVSYATKGVAIGGIGIGVPAVVALVIAGFVMAGLFGWLRVSPAGRRLRAVAEDPVGARLVGISVNRTFLTAFVVAAALAGIAGDLLSFTNYVFPTVGVALSLKAYAIVILGGQGSVPGAVVGSFLLAMVESLTSYYVSFSLAPAVAFLVVIVVLALRPQGLYRNT